MGIGCFPLMTCLVSEGLIGKMIRFVFCNLCDVSEYLWGCALLVVVWCVFVGSLSGIAACMAGEGEHFLPDMCAGERQVGFQEGLVLARFFTCLV